MRITSKGTRVGDTRRPAALAVGLLVFAPVLVSCSEPSDARPSSSEERPAAQEVETDPSDPADVSEFCANNADSMNMTTQECVEGFGF
jgi:hypothetical protein